MGDESGMLDETSPALIPQTGIQLSAYNFTILAGGRLVFSENSTLQCVEHSGIFSISGNVSVSSPLGLSDGSSISGCEVVIDGGTQSRKIPLLQTLA
jgi:hypothetical protein